jgi:transcriptional regulator with XRE-family HTH domain
VFDNESEKIRLRIKQLFDNSGLTGEKFAQKCGITRGTLYNIIKVESKFDLSDKTLASIANNLNIDYNWLIGKELSNDYTKAMQPQSTPESEQIENLKEQVRMLKDLVQAQKELSGSAIIETKDKMIKMLEEQVDDLKKRLREKDNYGNSNGNSKAS